MENTATGCSMLDEYGDVIEKVLFESKVAGITFIKIAGELLKSLRSVEPEKLVLELERDPNNQYDANAVKVLLGVNWSKKKYHIGYVPKELAVTFAYILDNDGYEISIEKTEIVGGVLGYETFGVRFEYRIKKKN